MSGLEPTIIVLIITTCAGAVTTVLLGFRKAISKIKCCFGSEIDFRENEQSEGQQPQQLQQLPPLPPLHPRTRSIAEKTPQTNNLSPLNITFNNNDGGKDLKISQM